MEESQVTIQLLRILNNILIITKGLYMNIDEQKQNMARIMTVLPRMTNYLRSGFRPEFDIPIKKNELKTLFEMDIHPDLPMKHYAEMVNMENGSFTYLADKLEKKGLINRMQSKKDKRVNVLSLTKKGKKVTEQMHDKFDVHLWGLTKSLDKEDMDNLNLAIKLLEDVLSKMEMSSTK